jgi:hypothetical protein
MGWLPTRESYWDGERVTASSRTLVFDLHGSVAVLMDHQWLIMGSDFNPRSYLVLPKQCHESRTLLQIIVVRLQYAGQLP